ncbi:hypothetical protein GGI10_004690, partial [Coemansia sp. RSA 2530]
MQVQIYCAALGGREFNSEMMDRMTRPARILADDQPPPTQEARAQAPPPPAPVASPRDDDQWGKGARGGAGGAGGQGNGNVVMVNDNIAAPQLRALAWTA